MEKTKEDIVIDIISTKSQSVFDDFCRSSIVEDESFCDVILNSARNKFSLEAFINNPKTNDFYRSLAIITECANYDVHLTSPAIKEIPSGVKSPCSKIVCSVPIKKIGHIIVSELSIVNVPEEIEMGSQIGKLKLMVPDDKSGFIQLSRLRKKIREAKMKTAGISLWSV